MSFEFRDQLGGLVFGLPERRDFPIFAGLLVRVCEINLVSIDSSIVAMNGFGSGGIVGRFFIKCSFRDEGDAIAGDLPIDDRSFAFEARPDAERILRIRDDLATG